MKSLKRKVLLSAIVLMFALVATVGSTYAWFTVSNTVTVQSMTLNVQSADNLLIAVADDSNGATYPAPSELQDMNLPSNYKSLLTSDDVLAVYSYNTWDMFPVTAIQSGYASKDAKTLMTMSMESNLVRDLTASAIKNSAGGDYIELRFWLYLQSNDGLDKNVVLNSLSITSSDTEGRQNVVNAVRLAAWVNDDYTASGVGPYVYTFASDGLQSAKIYAMDADYTYSFISTLPAYSTTAGEVSEISTFTIGTTEFNRLSQIDETIAYLATIADDTVGSTAIGLVSPDTPTLLTVRIYVEGWDSDSTNDISSAFFSINFTVGIAS